MVILEEIGKWLITLKSFPEDFKFAQSKGLCPGARATFWRFFCAGLRVGFLVVVDGGSSPPPDGDGAPSGLRIGAGTGGGGIKAESPNIRGTSRVREEEAR